MVRHARLRRRLLTAVLLFASPLPAAAQYGAPSPPRQEMPQGNESRNAQPPPAIASRADVLRAAVCVVGRDATAANALLATAPYSSSERDKAMRLLRAAERCLRLRAPLATSALLFRGAVAESLYETSFAQPAAARTPPAAAAAFFRASAAASREDAAMVSTFFDLAQCAAPREPGLVRALLATEPASDAESAALTALYPTFGQCVPAGTQLSIDRGGMRAMLAESLHRWSVVQRDGPTSPWAAAPETAAAPSN
jgi:hypothetical protein